MNWIAVEEMIHLRGILSKCMWLAIPFFISESHYEFAPSLVASDQYLLFATRDSLEQPRFVKWLSKGISDPVNLVVHLDALAWCGIKQLDVGLKIIHCLEKAKIESLVLVRKQEITDFILLKSLLLTGIVDFLEQGVQGHCLIFTRIIFNQFRFLFLFVNLIDTRLREGL